MTQPSQTDPTPAWPLARALRWGVVASGLCFGGLSAFAAPPEEALASARKAFATGAAELAAGVLDRLLSAEDLSPALRQ